MKRKCEKSPKTKKTAHRVQSVSGLKINYLKSNFTAHKSMTNTSNSQAKRMALKEISKDLLDLKNSGNLVSVNEGLKALYSEQGHGELKTFEQWERLGLHVKKGAKALYLWGRQTTKTITENGEEKEIKFFPMVALFSDLQVYNPNNNK